MEDPLIESPFYLEQADSSYYGYYSSICSKLHPIRLYVYW